ncbi:DUF6229 family protein [Sphingosinicella sp. LHD-64]|uniref:DUF6229 family protein n=1 Tax=Sphingosinicella sp. LHD-64 TaxID=3072139 RepID=UPI00280DC38F|nr:DUF6229 family protein [Sphingosinicella sp. LHD-64]MDQ8756593.1 DUF6229 family protein [Sphingosinicella sp. LHD-64]
MTKQATDLTTQWRSQADETSPAGPLFAGGALTMGDIVNDARALTVQCGTICTGSACCDCC